MRSKADYQAYPDLLAAINSQRISTPHESSVDIREPNVLDNDVTAPGDANSLALATGPVVSVTSIQVAKF